MVGWTACADAGVGSAADNTTAASRRHGSLLNSEDVTDFIVAP
jgi:hypothetical protein